MKVIWELKNSHHYEENWDKSDYYCPNCGAKTVWSEVSEGDYYVGSKYICTTCLSVSYLDNIRKSDKIDAKIAQQLQSGIALIPTTPKGN